jgi:hypothetical protein
MSVAIYDRFPADTSQQCDRLSNVDLVLNRLKMSADVCNVICLDAVFDTCTLNSMTESFKARETWAVCLHSVRSCHPRALPLSAAEHLHASLELCVHAVQRHLPVSSSTHAHDTDYLEIFTTIIN